LNVSKKLRSPRLPPDLLQLEEKITCQQFGKLQETANNRPIKILFVSPVEPLDVFFMINWFLVKGVSNIHVDFYSTDPILIKITSDGMFTLKELENYCSPQNLNIKQSWLRMTSQDMYQIDPRLLLKIQFHWVDSTTPIVSAEFDVILTGPVFSDTYEKVPGLNALPCYTVQLMSAP